MPSTTNPKTTAKPDAVKATPRPKNKPQQFNEVIVAALPAAPAISEATLLNSRVMLPAAFVLVSVIAGILAGLVLRESWATPTTFTPGLVAADATPQFGRIAEAGAIASAGLQNIQVTPDTMTFQSTGTLQGGSSANLAQPGLSAYEAQGSVGIAAAR